MPNPRVAIAVTNVTSDGLGRDHSWSGNLPIYPEQDGAAPDRTSHALDGTYGGRPPTLASVREPIDDAAPDFGPDEQIEQPAPEQDPFEYVLSKPIQAHGEEIKILKWREPTGGDIERAGNPVQLDFSGENPTMTFNERKMAAMISTLTAIPPSSVRQLTAKDWNAIAWRLFRFFTPPGA